MLKTFDQYCIYRINILYIYSFSDHLQQVFVFIKIIKMKNYIKNFYDMLKQDCTHHSGKACSEISTS